MKKKKEVNRCKGDGRGGNQWSYDRWGGGGGGGEGAGAGKPRSGILGPSGPPNIKLVGWPRALKKIKFRPGSAR